MHYMRENGPESRGRRVPHCRPHLPSPASQSVCGSAPMHIDPVWRACSFVRHLSVMRPYLPHGSGELERVVREEKIEMVAGDHPNLHIPPLPGGEHVCFRQDLPERCLN